MKLLENLSFRQKMLILIIVLTLVIAAILCFIFSLDKKEKDTKTSEKITSNTNPEIIKEEQYKGLKFSNITLIITKNTSTLSMDVTNTENIENSISQVNIPLKDKNGNVIITLVGYIGDDLKPNETRTIKASTSANLTKAEIKEITASDID